MNGLLGHKLGMTQVLVAGGRMVPVTVIEAGPCRVAQVKTAERDGYNLRYGAYPIEEHMVWGATGMLLGRLGAWLAIFLVFVVMALQYESLINPFVILLAIPLSMIGVGLALWVTRTPQSAPVLLGVILLAGIVVSSPVWLYQVWAFVLPGLHKHERKWTYLFVAVAGPLFCLGVATGYYVMPKALEVLISFTPDGMSNLNDFNDFFSFMSRMLIVFGIAFEIPFFVVLLNLAGVVSAKSLARHRPWIVLGTFILGFGSLMLSSYRRRTAKLESGRVSQSA